MSVKPKVFVARIIIIVDPVCHGRGVSHANPSHISLDDLI